MDDPDQSPLVSSSSTTAPPSAAAGQERWQPKQPPSWQYQFVREPEEEEEDEEEEEEEEDDEQLEVRERKPAAAPTSFAAPAPPLLDLGTSGEKPPTWSPSAPQPAWTSRHPDISSSSPSPTLASFPAAPEFAPPAAEKEKEPPRSSPPPPPPPHREEPPAPAVPPRSAPLPPKRDEPSAVAAKKVAASGSPDETLFALPVASEPLMHSSADKGMDSQELPSHAHLASQEDFAAVLLDATASLPSLSPLSANPFKEHAALDTMSDGLSAKSSYDQIEIEAFKAATKNARNPFLAEEDGDAPELKHSGDVPPYSGAELFSSLSQTEAAVDTKVRSDIEKITVYQQDSSPDSPVELFSKQDKDSFLEDRKYIDDYGDKVAFTDNRSVRDEYVDFKPFESAWGSNEDSGLKDSAKNQVDSKLESGIDKYDAEKGKTQPAQKDFEKESESSNEDISFPSTPEATKESSQVYITCAKFESAETVESNTAKSLPLVEEQASANKTDEKKIAEMKAHFGTEQSGTQAELASGQAQKADFDKAESLPKKPADAVANMPEGLTPDLVQEAYESELHDAISPKLAYETQIDLVQTSELLQEPLNAAVQLCPSFEGGTETAPSPVLPDIVMEAPLNASTVGVGGPAVQLEVSLSESSTVAAAAADSENVIEKSEKPPSYQETMNVLATQVQEPKVEVAAKEPDSQNGAAREDLDSYISIACDLVKETKVSSESASPAFTDYSKTVMTECVSQPVPEYPEHLEKASPQSGKTDLFITQPELHLAQKEREAVKEEKLLEAATKLVPEEGQKEKPEELQPPLSKPYLESFQPQLEPSERVSAGWSPEVEAANLAKKQKTPPMHMEELNTYSDDFTVSKEHQMWDKSVLSAESSPETDDFPRISYQAAESVMLATENGALKEDESREVLGAVKTELRQSPYQEVAQDLSLKNVHVRIEEQDLPLEKSSEKLDREVLEAAKVPPLPSERNVVSLGKEAERGVASVKEKEKLSPMFSTKLSKPSVVDLLYWRDVKKTGVVFGANLFLLLSLTVFSIVSVVAYIALVLLSVSISFRIYKGVIQAIQKSDEGHPFRAYLDKDVAVSEELVRKYSHVVLGHFNSTVKELRRLFLVDDLVDSLKFAVLMWVFTYVGALFNGLTLLILALISLFSIPVIYEKHQAQIDHYLGLVNKNVKDAVTKIQAKIPGLKRKAE